MLLVDGVKWMVSGTVTLSNGRSNAEEHQRDDDHEH